MPTEGRWSTLDTETGGGSADSSSPVPWPWGLMLLLTSSSYPYLLCCSASQLCPTLCNPIDCSPPGSSVHGIFQARVLEWAAIPFSRGSSLPRDQTRVSRIHRRVLTAEPSERPCPVTAPKMGSPPPQSISSNSTQCFLS